MTIYGDVKAPRCARQRRLHRLLLITGVAGALFVVAKPAGADLRGPANLTFGYADFAGCRLLIAEARETDRPLLGSPGAGMLPLEQPLTASPTESEPRERRLPSILPTERDAVVRSVSDAGDGEVIPPEEIDPEGYVDLQELIKSTLIIDETMFLDERYVDLRRHMRIPEIEGVSAIGETAGSRPFLSDSNHRVGGLIAKAVGSTKRSDHSYRIALRDSYYLDWPWSARPGRNLFFWIVGPPALVFFAVLAVVIVTGSTKQAR
jgi:hypothetical protein